MSERITVIGLGAIGFGIASNLLKGGHQVFVTVHRSKDNVDRLVQLGARLCKSKSEAVEVSDIVILCLPTSDDVSNTITEIWAVLNDQHLVLDTGTSSVGATLELAQRLTERSVLFAEAPLAGGKAQSDAGELGAFVGADDEVLDRVEPILNNFCSSILHFGPIGSGGQAKLISNYLVLGMVRSIIETFHAADVLGIDWEKFYRIICRGSGNSVALDRIIGQIVNDHDYGGYVFSVQNALKDSRYIEQVIRQAGLESSMSDSALKLFENATAAGLGDRMISELLGEDLRTGLTAMLNRGDSR
ncbi:MAG: NAD(P)-dependent oxidoreductase [Acidiferrobacterales bacterium]|nr:NAD(P)-dependent oxidoreductase [Acidiferrobacterales bacterium]